MKTGVGLYVKDSAQAVELYMKAFGLELGYHVKNPDGTYYHSELYRDGREIIDVVESARDCVAGNVAQLSIEFDDIQEVQRAYELLREGGSVEMPMGPLPWSPCACSVTDKFGVWWYLSACSHRPPDDFDPNKPWEPSMYKKP